MKFFDFGAFQKIMKMLSREKILFHMLFGASHGTPVFVKKTFHFQTLFQFGRPFFICVLFTSTHDQDMKITFNPK